MSTEMLQRGRDVTLLTRDVEQAGTYVAMTQALNSPVVQDSQDYTVHTSW